MHFQRLDMAKDALRRLDTDLIQKQLRENTPETEKDSLMKHLPTVSRVTVLNNGLMAALSANKPEFVRLYLDQGAQVLKLQPTDGTLLKEHKDLQKRVKAVERNSEAGKDVPAPAHWERELSQLPDCAVAIEQLYMERARAVGSHVDDLLEEAAKHRLLCAPTSQELKQKSNSRPRDYNAVDMEAVLSNLDINGVLTCRRNWELFGHVDEHAEECELMVTHMLFVSSPLWLFYPRLFRSFRQ